MNYRNNDPFREMLEHMVKMVRTSLNIVLDACGLRLAPVPSALLGVLAIVSTVYAVSLEDEDGIAVLMTIVCWILLLAKCIAHNRTGSGGHADEAAENTSKKHDEDENKNNHLYQTK